MLNLKTSRHVLKDLQLAASLLQPYNLNVNPVILTHCRVLRLTWLPVCHSRWRCHQRSFPKHFIADIEKKSSNFQVQSRCTHTPALRFHLTCVVVWLAATLTGDTDVGCWTVRICWPSATLTGSATDFWEALEVGEATDTTVTWQRQIRRAQWDHRYDISYQYPHVMLGSSIRPI